MACGKTRFALLAIARQIAPTTRLRHSGLASAIIRPNSLRARAGGTRGPSGPSGVSYLAMVVDYGARVRSAVKKCRVARHGAGGGAGRLRDRRGARGVLSSFERQRRV